MMCSFCPEEAHYRAHRAGIERMSCTHHIDAAIRVIIQLARSVRIQVTALDEEDFDLPVLPWRA